jgi:hypothetical protein
MYLVLFLVYRCQNLMTETRACDTLAETSANMDECAKTYNIYICTALYLYMNNNSNHSKFHNLLKHLGEKQTMTSLDLHYFRSTWVYLCQKIYTYISDICFMIHIIWVSFTMKENQMRYGIFKSVNWTYDILSLFVFKKISSVNLCVFSRYEFVFIDTKYHPRGVWDVSSAFVCVYGN